MPGTRTPITRGEFLRLAARTAAAAAASDLLLGAGDNNAAVEPADTVFLGGRVSTMETAQPMAQAVAVKNGLIQAVANDAAVSQLIGPETLRIDLNGRTMTPGFVDSHLHLQVIPMYGPYYRPFVPPAVTSLATLQQALAMEAQAVGSGEWVIGAYLGLGADGIPDRWDLDAVTPDNPVFLLQQAGHMGTVNSRALDIAGITAATPNPPGGIIERTSGGEPTGVLYNHRALDLVRRHMPEFGDEEIVAGIPPALAMFARFGVTSFHDNNVRGIQGLVNYHDIARDGKMTLRCTLYFTCEYPADVNTALNSLPQYEDAFCHFAGSKFLIDGQMPTAYCHEPHNGISWQTPTWEPTSFTNAVRALHAAGHQISVHCVGDAATDLALEAFEAAMNAHPRANPRHRIEHALITKPESTQRIKDLGVVISTQPLFLALNGETWRSILGNDRMQRAIVTREWLDAGIALALSSDAPTVPWYSPQMSIAAAMTRTTRTGEVVGPDQALTVQEALRAHTLLGAYAAHSETTRGSIKAGKYADLVVWATDPYTMTADEMQFARPDLTMVGGTIVHSVIRPVRRRLPGLAG